MVDPKALTTITSKLLSLTDLRLNTVFHAIMNAARDLLDFDHAEVLVPRYAGGAWQLAYSTKLEGHVSCQHCPMCCTPVSLPQKAEGADRLSAAALVVRPTCNSYVFLVPLDRFCSPIDACETRVAVCVHNDPDKPEPGTLQPTQETLALFAQIITLLIENALRDEQQFVLQETAGAFASDEGDQEFPMDRIARAIAERMRFEACTILAVTRDTCELRVVGTTGVELDKPRKEWMFDAARDISDPAVRVFCEGRYVVSNDLAREEWYHGCEPILDRVQKRPSQQLLAVPLFSVDEKASTHAEKPIGVLKVRNKKIAEGDFPDRSVDLLDLIEAQLIAVAVAPVLSMDEKERVRSEAVAQVRHDMYDPIHMIRDAAGKYARIGSERLKQCVPEIQQKMRDIESLCEILYANIQLTKALSYWDAEYKFEKTHLKSAIVVKLNKLFEKECKEYEVKGIFADDFAAIKEPIFVDRRMMHIVFYNLYRNAVKYSLSGTEITVSTSADEEWFHIDVSNYGIGIKEEDRHRVFRKWYRAPEAIARDRTGLGLGLFSVQEVVERHGGRVEVLRLSTPTTIRISLPRWLSERKPSEQ